MKRTSEYVEAMELDKNVETASDVALRDVGTWHFKMTPSVWRPAGPIFNQQEA